MSVFGIFVPVDTVIYVALGILIGGLIALAAMPFVHAHARQEATRRIEAHKPAAMTEIQAKKDALRADFAQATQRLEGNISDLKGKTAAHLTELARKADVIERLTAELGERTARIDALQTREDTLAAREKSLFLQLCASKDEAARLTGALAHAESLNADLRSQLDKLARALDERARKVASPPVDLVALQDQVDTMCHRVYDLANLVWECAHQGAFDRIDAADARHATGARRTGKAAITGVMFAGAADTVTEAAE